MNKFELALYWAQAPGTLEKNYKKLKLRTLKNILHFTFQALSFYRKNFNQVMNDLRVRWLSLVIPTPQKIVRDASDDQQNLCFENYSSDS